MSERIRLTTRLASLKKAESQKDGLFPGDVGNMEREKNYREIDQYSTFEQQVNHELPDMRHDWKDNPRNETGFGIPKSAKIMRVAIDATKLAYAVLGEKAPEAMVEAQARDFLRLGSSRLTAALNRLAETEELYPEVKEEAKPEVKAEVKAEVVPEVKEEAKPEVKAEVVPEVKEEAKPEVTTAPEVKDKATEETPEIKEEVKPEAVEAEENDADGISFDEDGSELDATEDVDDELNGVLFKDEEDEEEKEAKVKTASAKKGVKSLGGQPKIASVNADELTGLWKSTPEF